MFNQFFPLSSLCPASQQKIFFVQKGFPSHSKGKYGREEEKKEAKGEIIWKCSMHQFVKLFEWTLHDCSALKLFGMIMKGSLPEKLT